jgi:hypothetical protein
VGSNSTQGGTKKLNLSAEKLMLGLHGLTFIYTFNIHYCFTLQNYTKERAYIATQGMYALSFIITQYDHVQLVK